MMWWWGSGYGWIWMLVVWAVVIGGVIWVVTQLSARNGTRGQGGSSDARSILDERFARGEIDEDEYRRRRDELSS
jgi:putative membrane protein